MNNLVKLMFKCIKYLYWAKNVVKYAKSIIQIIKNKNANVKFKKYAVLHFLNKWQAWFFKEKPYNQAIKVKRYVGKY